MKKLKIFVSVVAFCMIAMINNASAQSPRDTLLNPAPTNNKDLMAPGSHIPPKDSTGMRHRRMRDSTGIHNKQRSIPHDTIGAPTRLPPDKAMPPKKTPMKKDTVR